MPPQAEIPPKRRRGVVWLLAAAVVGVTALALTWLVQTTSRPERLLNEIDLALNQNQVSRARSLLDAWLARAPVDPIARIAEARVLIAENRPAEKPFKRSSRLGDWALRRRDSTAIWAFCTPARGVWSKPSSGSFAVSRPTPSLTLRATKPSFACISASFA
jgi:hypothetical protein